MNDPSNAAEANTHCLRCGVEMYKHNYSCEVPTPQPEQRGDEIAEFAKRRLELIYSISHESHIDPRERLATIKHEAEHCLGQMKTMIAAASALSSKGTTE